jgi:hypothetical protein
MADYIRPTLAGLLRATEVAPTAVVLPRAELRVEVLTLRRKERLWAGPEPASFRSVPNNPRSNSMASPPGRNSYCSGYWKAMAGGEPG